MSVKCTMILGDCLEVMPTLPKKDLHVCFADVPYAPKHTHCTRNTWDKHFPLDPFWESMWPVMTDGGQLIMSGNVRLISCLLERWPKMFRYDLVWQKTKPVGFLDANRRPLRGHEMIAVMSDRLGVYNPQKTSGQPYIHCPRKSSKNYDACTATQTVNDGDRYPTSVLRVAHNNTDRIHPTQKPVALLDWIINTYSNPGERVLDPVAGSFTTCVSACLNGRSSIGVEKDSEYFEAGVERVRKTVKDSGLDVKIEVRR